MSFDPFGQHPDSPPPPGGGLPPSNPPSGHPPPGYPPGLSAAQARERVQLPGIFLIAVGVLNLLFALYIGFQGVLAGQLSEEQFKEMVWEKQDAKRREALEKEGITPEQMQRLTERIAFGAGGAELLASFLVVLGGVRMLQVRSFGLCVLASIVVATPCLSPCGTCCVGNIVGIWALIVLMTPEVRTLFP